MNLEEMQQYADALDVIKSYHSDPMILMLRILCAVLKYLAIGFIFGLGIQLAPVLH